MKKIIALTLVLAMVALVFTSCSTILIGEYGGKSSFFGLAGAEVTYKFVGNKVTVTTKANVVGFEKETTIKAVKRTTFFVNLPLKNVVLLFIMGILVKKSNI